ncbi:MAG TPA: ATP-binding protein [Steroidobacteraceae bacterium]|nr:ATP-binding protein [Steroidobacteraceae bacterium]
MRAAATCLGGGTALVLLSAACFRMQTGLAPAAFALLIVVTLISLLGDFAVSIILSFVAVLCLNFFFAEPIFSIWVAKAVDLSAIVSFLTTSIIITGLSVKLRTIAEQKLEQTRAELARFARVASLGELTASIAHEVNQPLAGVVSSGSACQRWLASDPPNIERAVQSVERIIRDANRASQVVERIRNLAKNAPPNKASVNMNDAVLEIMALTRGEIEENGVSLKTELAEGVPAVWADRIQLQQVILNLVINAIEAMDKRVDGPKDLFIAVGKDDSNDILFTIRDSGTGLDPQKAQQVFDAFYTTKREGMGMGLAVSRGIIEAHGGRLWATPNEPVGAVFQFKLPMHREEAA